MTELFIDGVAVVLPQEFTVSVKRENPLFKKNGEYTYDITIPLHNPVNANLYKHLNRLNSIMELKTKRTAILISDSRVYCHGTEIVSGWTNDSVTIQLVSGNSEFNYLIGNNMLISSLKMKETDSANLIHTDYVTKLYPEVDYCLAPVVNSAQGYCLNKWGARLVSPREYILIPDGDHWVAQPYLFAYIEEVLKALNYRLIENQLLTTVFSKLYICHTTETYKWCEMLPGWSVEDFFEQIEFLFNVVIVVDNRKKTVRILQKNSFYITSQNIHVQQVSDVFEANIDDDLEINLHSVSNVRYKLPDSAYWRWKCVPSSVIKASKKEIIPKDFKPDEDFLKRLYAWFGMEEHNKLDTIFEEEVTGRQFISWRVTGYQYYKMVNEFQALINGDTDNEIELEMIPVEMELTEVVYYGVNNQKEGAAILYLPVMGTTMTGTDSGEEKKPIYDMLDNGVSENISDTKNPIYLAFFHGQNSPSVPYYKKLFPQPFTDEYIQDDLNFCYLTNTDGATLRLKKLGELYEGKYDIDLTKGIVLKSYDPNVYDPRSIFEIRNKRYVCGYTEYVLDANGRKGAWTGTFYPIQISDIEVDKRWILTDGKWRDGGTWVDNGRWMDE